ncbi:hypothetical protein OOT55_09750 [Marinimicrobium sp. C6131]|uniref:hypothetical protein n=1 Tax=Marinimicrobium sp. C6131 TaxID=3022676 RepID=UPI00223D7487|nr:hypothetical protein [Marinimicrobium sp. C6131]UZJ42937.1 hypothetical protein OOT55_09750 [Marinimicrobium sp. C6131]
MLLINPMRLPVQGLRKAREGDAEQHQLGPQAEGPVQINVQVGGAATAAGFPGGFPALPTTIGLAGLAVNGDALNTGGELAEIIRISISAN